MRHIMRVASSQEAPKQCCLVIQSKLVSAHVLQAPCALLQATFVCNCDRISAQNFLAESMCTYPVLTVFYFFLPVKIGKASLLYFNTQ